MKILKYKKFTGLHIVCKKCNKLIEVSQDTYKGCKHPIDRQKYKAILRQDGSRKTRDLKALEYDDAIKELLEFKHELSNPIRFSVKVPKVEVKIELLKDCIMMFADWLENVDVPRHQQRPRSSGYITTTVQYIVRFSKFLENNKFDLNKFKIYDLNDAIVGKYYDYLDETCKMASTHNHNTKALKNFNNFLINHKGFNIPNYFGKIKLKYESMNPTSIKDDDFKKLLGVISCENSIEIHPNGRRKNMYRPYTKDAIELVAYTGMRIEETMVLKFSDIVLDNDGNIQHLVGTDLKFERAHNWNNTKAPKKVMIPTSTELENLLNRLEYKKHLGADKYLIADDYDISRKTLKTQISHSFTFFRKKAGLSDDFSIKHLRKTFLTKLHTKTGFIESLGYQRSAKVTLNNYIDKVQVVKEINRIGFGYFDK
ncbi:tyrosine-type recombinase/integrase [Flavobacterium degerlachei]|jgi:integrase|uniref:Phage integrase family protein n=1 Tax=Flavobacterium degerlachei TaxID=229203 RepID=A0A1H3D3E3_9FLAO|nr:tyrosine-type recombinase/integrase [Flavobacterium degerlachei]SDX60274.1 Phage integrase family protein [Flavobacterium degerlachei]